MFYKILKSYFFQEAKDWSSMTVPEILKETVAGDKFLQLEESITDKYGTEKKIVIFLSPNQLEMLNFIICVIFEWMTNFWLLNKNEKIKM